MGPGYDTKAISAIETVIPRYMLIEIRRVERERCAKIADVIAHDSTLQYSDEGRQRQARMTAEEVARAIRYAEDE